MLYSLLTVSLLAFASFSEEGTDEAVVTLTDENFNDFITSHSRVLVEFYAPWCGHCKSLAPEYENAAQKIHNDESLDVFLAKVDATENKELSGKYGVKGFPTLKYFTGDLESPSDYSGGRTEDTIISWISKRAQPAVMTFDSSEGVEAFRSKNKLVLLACLTGDKESNTEVSTFYDTCEVVRESVSCALVSDTSVCGDNKVILYRQFDDPEVPHTGELTVEAISAFVNSERFPLVDEIGPDNYKDYMDRGVPLVWIALDGDNEEQKTTVIAAVTPAARSNKGALSFTWIDNNKYAQHVGNLGLSNVPGIIVVNGAEKYIYTGDSTKEDEVTAFFTKYNNGELEKFLKTEAVPEPNDEPVTVIVGSTFNDYIGSDRDVFVEFYAPWCGHCKRLAPEYEKVGEEFKEISNLVIAKVDATENDTPEAIKGFPTLIWYPAGQTTGTKYEGGRTADDIIGWIKEHATVDMTGAKTDL
jgi:protein disulfide-isomerase A1